MREQFKKLKERLQRQASGSAGQRENKGAKTTDGENSVEQERREILGQARSFIKPLVMNRRRVLATTATIVAGLLIIALTVVGFLIYQKQSDSDLVYRVSQIVPYPAARVDGTFMMYDDYLFELKALKHYYENPVGAASATREAVDFTTPEGQQQLKELQQVAFAETKKKLVVHKLAKEEGVSVSRAELQEAMDEYVEREGGEEKLQEAISYFYGWNLSDFRRVLRFQLLQQKLPQAFSEDKRAVAEEVLTKAKGGEDFAQLAEQYSEDPGSKEEGGDLGFVNENTQFVEEFKQAALQLEPGQVSDIVESQFGYHIIKAGERNDEGEIRVSHVLIQYEDVQPLIQERMDAATVNSYIGITADPVTEEATENPEAAS